MVLTFDHFGEAAELEHKVWPAGAPLGEHRSVAIILPQVLTALERQGVRATFFVEAWNAAHYPDQLRDVAERGHEIACHSYRHENWEHLGLDEIDDIMARSTKAYEQAELAVRGVRPPGGIPPLGYADVLRTYGINFVSMANDNYGVEDGLAHIPFQWRAVDGAYYTSQFAKLREPPGDCAVSVSEMLDAWDRVLDDVVAGGGCVSFVFHLPWQDSADRLAAVEQFAKRLAVDDRLWVATAGSVADWMVSRADDYPYVDPETPRQAWTPEEIERASALSASLVASGRDSQVR